MNARTTMSAKGQVVIPKDVRDSLGIEPGQQLDVVKTGGGVLLRPVRNKSGRTTEQILNHLRELVPPYNGPPISIEDMNRAVDRMFQEEWKI